MRDLRLLFIGIICLISSTLSAQVDNTKVIQEAGNANKYLFILFYKDKNENTLRLQQPFDQAVDQLGKKIVSLKVDINNPSSTNIIHKYNLERSPMPFALILAPNGAVTGGFPNFTKEQLLGSIISEGAANCLKVLQDKNLLLILLKNDQTVNNNMISKVVEEFKKDSHFVNKIEVIVIDPTNIKEQKFLSQLGLVSKSSQAVTVLMSPPGLVIGKYQGTITKEKLVTDLKKATGECCKGGCCSGKCCK